MLCMRGYRNLPFPFDDVGLGREGEPSSSLDTEHDMSFEGLIGIAAFVVSGDNSEAAGRGPVGEGVVKELEEGWGGPSLVRKVTFKAFLLAGTPRV
nr:unnamed protein product [Digitaria exilis]